MRQSSRPHPDCLRAERRSARRHPSASSPACPRCSTAPPRPRARPSHISPCLCTKKDSAAYLRIPHARRPAPPHADVCDARRRAGDAPLELAERPHRAVALRVALVVRHLARLDRPDVVPLRLGLLALLVVARDVRVRPQVVPDLLRASAEAPRRRRCCAQGTRSAAPTHLLRGQLVLWIPARRQLHMQARSRAARQPHIASKGAHDQTPPRARKRTRKRRACGDAPMQGRGETRARRRSAASTAKCAMWRGMGKSMARSGSATDAVREGNSQAGCQEGKRSRSNNQRHSWRRGGVAQRLTVSRKPLVKAWMRKRKGR